MVKLLLFGALALFALFDAAMRLRQGKYLGAVVEGLAGVIMATAIVSGLLAK